MKNLKLPFFILLLGTMFLMCGNNKALAQKCPNHIRAGLNYAFLTESDHSGFLMSNQFTRCFSQKIEASITGSYFNSTRYDEADKIYTSMKTFKMLDATVLYKPLCNKRFALKVGVGPSVRHRAEIDALNTAQSAGNARLASHEFVHTKTFDIGAHAMLENDFYLTDNIILAGRIIGYQYDEGSGLFGFGLNMGYRF